MTTETEPTTWQTILSDHVDARPVTGDLDQAILGRNDIVQLDPDHPGFRDPEYRRRRNQIAQIAMNYHPRDPIPDAPYTPEEHQVWKSIWTARNEQGFEFRQHGNSTRTILDYGGIALVTTFKSPKKTLLTAEQKRGARRWNGGVKVWRATGPSGHRR